MKLLSRSLVAGVLAGSLGILTACSSTHGTAAPAPAPAQVDMQAMMAEMQRLGTPGQEHAALMKDAGVWDCTYKFRMAPEAPWEQAKGVTNGRPLLDGRYLWQDVEWTMRDPQTGSDVPLKGFQILGFDNASGEYTSTWADSWSTWMVSCRGKKDARGVIDMRGTMKDVAGERPFRMLVTEQGADARLVKMYDTIPPQGEVVVMEIEQRRRK